MVASYSGDNSFNASTSSSDAITITKAATTTAVSAPASVTYRVPFTLTATVDTQSNGAAPSGTVQFFNGSNPIGGGVSCGGTSGSTSLFATCGATLSTSLTAKATITAQYSGDGNYTSSTSAAVTVDVPPDFSLTPNPTSLTISSPGQSATSAIAVAFINGFTGTVTLTCVVPPAMAEAGCSLNPSSLVNQGSTTLTITTTAPHSLAGLYHMPGWFAAGGGLLFACVLLLSVPVKKRRWSVALGVFVLGAAAAIATNCGGGGGGGATTTDPGTPAGKYSVSLTGTSGKLMHSMNISVTVQ